MPSSSASVGLSGGEIQDKRAASIELPAPAVPTVSRLWRPAAAIPATLLGHRPIAAGFDKYTETDLSLDPQCSTFVSLVVEPNTDIFRLARSEFTMCIPEIVIATIQMSHVPVTTYWHEL